MKFTLALALAILTTMGTAQAAISPDPLDVWTRTEFNMQLGRIAYGSGIFVTCDSSSTSLLTSSDGASWIKRETTNNLSLSGYNDVAYGNGRFVAVGHTWPPDRVLISTSLDGINWTVMTPPSMANFVNALSCVTYGNGLFIALGAGVFSSPDGVAWSQRIPAAIGGGSGFKAIAFGNGLFVAITGGNPVATSTDGIDWVLGTLPARNGNGITYGNGLFVAVVNGDNSILTSSDGKNWIPRYSSGWDLRGVGYGSGTYVAVGSSGVILTSPDGLGWFFRRSDTTENFLDVCYGGDMFVVVGGGTILNSQPFVTYRDPVITAQPTNQVALTGEQVTLGAGIGGDVPFIFSWEKDGQKVPGGTNATLVLTNVQPADSGSYQLFLTNAIGVTNTAPAILAVRNIEVIPNGQLSIDSTFTAGGSATLTLKSVYANGSIFYTLDGSEPDFNATPYQAPFQVSASSVLRAVGYSQDLSKSVTADPFTITIVFNYRLSVTPSPAGWVYVDPPSDAFMSNSVATLTAYALPGWTFMNWSGSTSGSSVTNIITMNSDKQVQAVFGTTVGSTVAGNGTVSLFPASDLYPYGSTVQVVATPAQGSYFGVWGNAASGNQNPLSFVVTNANSTISSLFAPLAANQAALTVHVDGGGHVTSGPAANRFTIGNTVTLTAVPNPGQQFLAWDGDAKGAANPLALVMDASKVVTALFTRVPRLGITGTNSASLQLTLMGVPGDSYRIESSSNASAWTPLTTFTNFFDAGTIVDPDSQTLPYRIYRAFTLP
jgi:Divergent InlB B-repeat domain/Chitobiase/beta-hexosaminidase C-terminal domain/Immunoglobulin domain